MLTKPSRLPKAEVHSHKIRLIILYDLQVLSIMNYTISAFIHLENKLLALSKRFPKIICPNNCKGAIKLVKYANSLNTHRLHSLVPKILTYSKKLDSLFL